MQKLSHPIIIGNIIVGLLAFGGVYSAFWYWNHIQNLNVPQ